LAKVTKKSTTSKKPARPAVKPRPKPMAAAKKPPAKPPAKPARPAKPAKPVALPRPVLLPKIEATQAPSKFRREYRRWKDLLITLRHRLLAEGSHLEEEGLKALEQEVSVDHMADFGSDSSEQETTLQLIESNSLSVRDVDDALKRIDAGTYGLCEDCEQLIPSARLSVLPHARFCISCQSKREGMTA
jgi:DnaK suppressor protein